MRFWIEPGQIQLVNTIIVNADFGRKSLQPLWKHGLRLQDLRPTFLEMTVTLTVSEMVVAASVGCRRNIASIHSKHENKHGLESDDNGWNIHILGAMGEMAFSKAMGMYWCCGVNTFHAPDIGQAIQVRTRSKRGYELIVREADSSDDIFVLVLGQCPTFDVVGWLYGWECKNEEWLKSYGNRPSAYFVPTDKLNKDFDALKKLEK